MVDLNGGGINKAVYISGMDAWSIRAGIPGADMWICEYTVPADRRGRQNREGGCKV